MQHSQTRFHHVPVPSAAPITAVVQKTANYTVTAGDFNGATVLAINSGTAKNVTIAASLTVTEPLWIIQTGVGLVTIVEDSGVTVNAPDDNLVFEGQHYGVMLIPDGADNYRMLPYSRAAGISGVVAVDDETVEIVSAAARLNFTGAGVVATDAGSGVVDVTIAGAAASGITLDPETANYTLIDDDLAGGIIKTMNVAGANTFTVAKDLIGTEPVTVIQTGPGQTTIVAAIDVSIYSADSRVKLRTRYSSATLIPAGTNAYYLIGDLET